MWILLSSLFLLFSTPVFLHAAPALEEFLALKQPDGTSFLARKRGDEFQNWTESESGYTVIRNRTTKFWEYASQKPDGTLLPSGQKYYPERPAPAALPILLKPPRNSDAEQAQSTALRLIYLKRKPGGFATTGAKSAVGINSVSDWNPVPVSGNRKLIVILVGFADAVLPTPLSTTPASWYDTIFSTTAGAKSVANYYLDNSFSTLSVTPVPHSQPGSPPGIVSVTVPYVHPDNGTAEEAWVEAAITAADAFVHFDTLDANANGFIDLDEAVVYLIPAGYEETSTHKTPSVWAHARRYSGSGFSAAGKLFPVFAMSGELNHYSVQLPIGVIAHELGHQFCGLPDLYDTSGRNQGMGQFSLMGSGNWGADTGEYSGTTPTTLDAWSREFLGWAAPKLPVSPSTISLAHPLSSPDAAYRLVTPAVSASEYFLLENRQPVGWDRGLRGGLAGFGSGWTGGLLLMHVDITAGTIGYNNINNYYNDAGHQGVVPVQAATASCDMLSFGSMCRGSATTLFYAGNNSSWTPVTTPDSNYYSGTATGFNLLNISAIAPVMAADFVLIPPTYKSISVSSTGTGIGTVTSSPRGISCGSGCIAPFIMGSAVTLTAVAPPGFGLIGWSGGGCSGTGTCTFTVDSDTVVSAQFGPSVTVNISSSDVPRAIYDNSTQTSVLTVPAAVCSKVADLNVRVNITHSWIGELKVSISHNESGKSSDLFVNSCSSNDYIRAVFDDEASGALVCPPVGSYRPATPLDVFDGLDPAGTWTLTFTDNGTFDIGMVNDWGVSFSCLNTLGVLVGGSGAGTVTSSPQTGDPPAIACNSGACQALFPSDLNVALIPVPDAYSTFGGWSGTCSGGDPCSIIMNLPKSAEAAFVLASPVKNPGSGQSFNTLKDAYTEALSSGTLLTRISSSPLSENLLTLDRGIDITIKGGFNAGYTTNTGYTTILGRVNLSSGLLRVERIILQSPP